MRLTTQRSNILLFFWLVAAAGLTLPLFLWQLDYFRSPGPGYREAFLALAAALVLTAFLYARARPRFVRTEPWVFAAIPVALGLLHDPRSTAVILLMVASSYALGSGLLGLLSLEADAGVRTALGLGVEMTAMSWLGLAGLLFWPAILAALLIPLAIFRRVWRELPRSGPAAAPRWNSLAFIFGLAITGCATAVAIAPALALDVVRVHLPFAQFYAAHHRIAPLALSPYSYFPQGMETLMAAGFSLGGRTAAQATPVLFLGLAAFLCRSLALKAGADRSAAWLAAVCAAALPFAHWTGSVGKNDLALVCFELASLYCIVECRESGSERWLLPAAAFLGFAASVKYTVLYGAVPLALLLVYECRRHRWRILAPVAAIFAISGLIWPARAWMLTGNPVYPERLAHSGSFQLAKAAQPWTAKLIAFVSTPWTVQFHPVFATPLHAPLGILFALFLPAWFLSRAKWNAAARYCLFFAVLYWLYWAAIWPVLRFGVAPLMVFAVLTIVSLFSCYTNAPGWLRWAIDAALAYSLLFALSATMIMEINAPQLRFLARRIDATQYLNEVLPSYASMSFLKSVSGPDDLILSAGNCSLTYAPFPWNCECLNLNSSPQEIQAQLARQPFRFLILPSHRAAPAAAPGEPIYRDQTFSVYRLR